MSKILLAYMDFNTHTGFGTVSRNLMERLLPYFSEKGYTVFICATNYHGKQFYFKVSNGGKNYSALVTSAKDTAKNMEDMWHRDGFLKLLNDMPVNLVWIINDIPVVTPMVPVIEKIRKEYKPSKKMPDFKTVLYCPVDSRPNPDWMNGLEKIDKVVTYTHYGKREIDMWQQNRKKKIDVSIIPHGVDTNDFFPLAMDREKTRVKYGMPKDAFIFGNINKNNARKNIGGTLLAFRDFVEKWKGFKGKKLTPHLYLHMSPTDDTGINLYRACKNLGIEQYVSYPNADKYKKGYGYDVEEMNEIYNCLDCYVTTTGAEGWGLSITEAMAANLPIIAPMHTSITEITDNGKAVYAVHTCHEHIQVGQDYENVRHIPDVKEVAVQMLNAYYHASLTKKESLDAQLEERYEFLLKQYDWDIIAEGWQGVFDSL